MAKKIMKNIIEKNLMLLVALFISICALLIDKNLISSRVVGSAAVVFLSGLIGVEITRRNNKIAQEEELKKKLEVNVLQELTPYINSLGKMLSDVISDIEFIIETIKSPPYKPSKVGKRIEELIPKLRKAEYEKLDFILSIQSNKIVLLDFNRYTYYLAQYFRNNLILVGEFIEHLRNLQKEGKVESHIKEIEVKGDIIDKEISTFMYYLEDYQNELSNTFLSHLFKKIIPKRIPPKNHKTLQEMFPEK